MFLNGIPAFRLVMQKDSNLVLYTDDDNRVLWATNTPRPLGNNPIFILQNDRNAVVYSYPINRGIVMLQSHM
ncbi:hypothetical protein GCM10007332_24570 [Epilithonimonas arachidiradicis]|uniref:Bulb-type lectin domain-containing protein n=1 Tax=Epilithonimonas arachidiradicis TaxID=1617282 RepID=A0ABQ1X9A9_9FLAO|nr:hypothetical protein GCM10007332_24570 [Epilithonimonas arachidiradicis]